MNRATQAGPATAIFYGSLSLATLIAALAPREQLGPLARQWALALVVSVAVWYWIAMVESEPAPARLIALNAAVLTVFWLVLVLIHPAFYLVLVGLWALLWSQLPRRWAAAASALLALLAAITWLA